MLSLNEIRNVHFRKTNFGGYKAEDVEAFIDEVQQSYDQLLKENADLQKKVDVLAQKLEEYQNEEDAIRSALMNAQKLGDASLRDAKHKSEIIIKDATIKSEKIVANAQAEIKREKEIVDRMQKDVADFKTNLLKLYKEHLQLINNIRSEEVLRPATREAAQSVQIITPQYEEHAPMDMAASAPVGVPPVMEQNNTMDTFNVQQPPYDQPPYEQPVPSFEPNQQFEPQMPIAHQQAQFESQLGFQPNYQEPQNDNTFMQDQNAQMQQMNSQVPPQMPSATQESSFDNSYGHSMNNSFERTPARGGFKVNIAPEEASAQQIAFSGTVAEPQMPGMQQNDEISFDSYDAGNMPLSSVFEERNRVNNPPVMSPVDSGDAMAAPESEAKKSKSPLGLFKRRK